MTLIDRLSKLDGPDREEDGEIMQHFGIVPVEAIRTSPDDFDVFSPVEGKGYSICTETFKIPAYTASVDAAISLAERALTGWVFDNVGQDFHSVPNGYEAFGWTVEMINGNRVQGQAPTLPLAICIAILRAKEASNG